MRLLASSGLAFIVSHSFSKNLSVYGERCGALSFVCGDAGQAQLVLGQLKATVRRNYSSPPIHGGQIVAHVLAEGTIVLVGLVGAAVSDHPKIVEIVSWAAGNGDRSENGDYLYGRKRMREIDRELAHLARRMKAARVIDPADQPDTSRVWFGATITIVGTPACDSL